MPSTTLALGGRSTTTSPSEIKKRSVLPGYGLIGIGMRMAKVLPWVQARNLELDLASVQFYIALGDGQPHARAGIFQEGL